MKIARTLIHFALFATLCAVLAYWIVQLRAPDATIVPIPPSAIREGFNLDQQSRLFGNGVVASASNIRLTGVIASSGNGSGIAALSIDNKPPRAYRAGQAITPSATLLQVKSDRVVLRQNGTAAEVLLQTATPSASGMTLQNVGGGNVRVLGQLTGNDPHVGNIIEITGSTTSEALPSNTPMITSTDNRMPNPPPGYIPPNGAIGTPGSLRYPANGAVTPGLPAHP